MILDLEKWDQIPLEIRPAFITMLSELLANCDDVTAKIHCLLVTSDEHQGPNMQEQFAVSFQGHDRVTGKVRFSYFKIPPIIQPKVS